MNITILGTGSWACALAQVLDDNGHSVLMWSKIETEVEELNRFHTASKYLKDVTLSSTIKATNDLEQALNHSSYIVIAVASKFIRDVLISTNPLLKTKKCFINVSKGIEPETHLLVGEIVQEVIAENYFGSYVVLSGPTHAEEVIERKISTIVSASLDIEVAKQIQLFFNNNYMRVYVSDDPLGVQLGGSLKNVIAIASGICSGIGLGDNTRAALITRGLHEIVKYSLYKGAKLETLYGLAGLGDLIVTTSSVHSRNFKAGFEVGQGSDPSIAIGNSFMVVEGVRTSKALSQELKHLEIEMPISSAVYSIFYEAKDPHEALEELMARDVTTENKVDEL